jgi:hypothetical protein
MNRTESSANNWTKQQTNKDLKVYLLDLFLDRKNLQILKKCDIKMVTVGHIVRPIRSNNIWSCSVRAGAQPQGTNHHHRRFLLPEG